MGMLEKTSSKTGQSLLRHRQAVSRSKTRSTAGQSFKASRETAAPKKEACRKDDFNSDLGDNPQRPQFAGDAWRS